MTRDYGTTAFAHGLRRGGEQERVRSQALLDAARAKQEEQQLQLQASIDALTENVKELEMSR